MIGNVNAEESEDTLAYFLNCHNASNIVRDKTCFKSLSNPSCIDLIIGNKPSCFQNTVATSSGLSDCHKFVTTRKHHQKKHFIGITNTLIMKISKKNYRLNLVARLKTMVKDYLRIHF